MGVKENLSVAMVAVAHVKGVMTLGASNKIGDLVGSVGKSWICVLASRSVDISVPKEKGDGNLIMPGVVRGWAAKATELGCGNCGEQSSVALEFLKARRTRPLDMMAFKSPGDHAFVVVGRAKNSEVSDYKTWGPDAVICDPWDGKAFLASEIATKMLKRGKYGFVVILRVD